jgi:hypothetical protein
MVQWSEEEKGSRQLNLVLDWPGLLQVERRAH